MPFKGFDMLRYYDIHAHLADARLAGQLDAILARSREAGVRGILANAARLAEWDVIVELSGRDIVYGAVGLHPFFSTDWTESCGARLRQIILEEPKVVAIGEIGLDFYSGRDDVQRQIHSLRAQLEIAHELNVPVILHNRKSWNEFFQMLKDVPLPAAGGVLHHFTGSRELARQAMAKGLYISFCGPLTYSNARTIKDVARYVPLDRILTETDTPDLPAARYRGGQSHPYHVPEIVRELARLRGCEEAEVCAQVEDNFRTLIGGSHYLAGNESACIS